MQDVTVNLSDEDFTLIHEALRRVNTPYTHDEAAEIVKLEREAWEAIQRYAPPGVSRRRLKQRRADQPS